MRHLLLLTLLAGVAGCANDGDIDPPDLDRGANPVERQREQDKVDFEEP